MVELLSILRRETTIFHGPWLLMLLLSAFSYAALLHTINITVVHFFHGTQEFHLLLFFVACVVMLFVSARIYINHALEENENLVYRKRNEIFQLLRGVNLEAVEQISKAAIRDRLTDSGQNLSIALTQFVEMILYILRGLFVVIYSITVSEYASLWIGALLLAGGYLYRLAEQRMIYHFEQADHYGEQFINVLQQLVDGFNELRMNHRKANHLQQHFEQSAQRNRDARRGAGAIFSLTFIASNVAMFTIIGTIIFILPTFDPEITLVQISNMVTIVLFLFVPIDVAITYISSTSIAAMNLQGIEALGELLAARQRPENRVQPFTQSRFHDFQQITLSQIQFAFHDAQQRPTFQSGPIDLTIRRGELIFIVGGNGAGKSIFLKLLTGLYYPQQGELFVDQQLVNGSYYEEYRDLFSILLTDFYLFDPLLDFDESKQQQANQLLEQMQLHHKTAIHAGRFTTTALSTGQRKRLGYIIARLEDRPIVVFDEFAADQDPLFKKQFYEQQLLQLKQEGKTVLCVTHDEHYFHLADRILVLRNGHCNEYLGARDNIDQLLATFIEE